VLIKNGEAPQGASLGATRQAAVIHQGASPPQYRVKAQDKLELKLGAWVLLTVTTTTMTTTRTTTAATKTIITATATVSSDSSTGGSSGSSGSSSRDDGANDAQSGGGALRPPATDCLVDVGGDGDETTSLLMMFAHVLHMHA
jgi:hypothetical protein